jgi:tetratricopeptide (TPR) repeat protein
MALASPRGGGAPARASSSSSPCTSPLRRTAVATAATAATAAGLRVAAPATPTGRRHNACFRGRLAREQHRQHQHLLVCRAASSSSDGDGGRPASTTPTTPKPVPTPSALPLDDLPPPHDPSDNAYVSAEAAEKLWHRLTEARRELAAAVSQEDFAAAARLRDEARALAGSLPPVRQYVLHQLERLRTGEPPAPLLEESEIGGGLSPSAAAPVVPVGESLLLDSPQGSNSSSSKKSSSSSSSNGGTVRRGIRAETHGNSNNAEDDDSTNNSNSEDAAARRRARRAREKLAAVAALGEVGDAAVLPDLARALRDPELQPAAQEAMWAVFGRSADPRVTEMMEDGGKLLGAGAGGPGGTNPSLEAALAAFERVLELAPDFAEAHNKRATVLYLLGRHEQAVSACEACLAVNPWHFGAASGEGLCQVALQRPREALRAFERALEIHPGLTQIARYAATLRGALEEQRMRAEARERLVEEEEEERSSGGEGDGGAAAAPW